MLEWNPYSERTVKKYNTFLCAWGRMMLNLYEVVRYGNDSDNIFSGGPNGPDTCFLVRANSPEAAAGLVDPILARNPHERVKPWSQLIYLLAGDCESGNKPAVLRGPYEAHAYCHDWRSWNRNKQGEPWGESIRAR
jgi:hypothetical protein